MAWMIHVCFSYLAFHFLFVQVVDTKAPMPSIPEWFRGSRLNYAENLLQGNDEDVAIYTAGLNLIIFILNHGVIKYFFKT